jgi:hypothetical protein
MKTNIAKTVLCMAMLCIFQPVQAKCALEFRETALNTDSLPRPDRFLTQGENKPWTAVVVDPIFTKIQNSPVVSTLGDSRSVNWIDVDSDGDLDLFISNGKEGGENNFLYKNDGNGLFTAYTNDPIVQDFKPSDGATWADFDNDGDNDCFVVNWYGVSNLFYKNDGNGNFSQVSTGAAVTDGGHSETAAWGDYDNDGFLDLYVTNSGPIGSPQKNFMYRNNGSGHLDKITMGPQVNDVMTSRCVNWTDYDTDGDLDLFITNEGNSNEAENLYQNNGNGSFSKITSGSLLMNGGKTMSASWGDYDNDGKMDVFLANYLGANALFHNDGNGAFTKITSGPVVTGTARAFCGQWADIDHDADLDLFVTNSFGSGLLKNFLFINQGDGTFIKNISEVVATDEGWSYGCAFGDMDHDGDLDLAVANCYNESQEDYLYENHSAATDRHWLMVHCVGVQSNKSAIGAKVRVKAIINGQMVEQMREISAQSAYCGQNQLTAHFGLGDAETVLEIKVEWPSGMVQVFEHIFGNQYVTIVEDQGISLIDQPTVGIHIFPPSPNPFSDSSICIFEIKQASNWQIEVTDIQGRVMRQLARQVFPAGENQIVWDGSIEGGGVAPSGTYLLVFKGEKGIKSEVVIKK